MLELDGTTDTTIEPQTRQLEAAIDDVHQLSALAAYAFTHSDQEAAIVLGIPHHAQRRWRQERGLLPKNLKPSVAQTVARVQALLEASCDEAAAGQVGLSLAAWRRWRRRSLLPSPPSLTTNEGSLLRGWMICHLDEALAKHLGIAPSEAADLRARHRLPELHQGIVERLAKHSHGNGFAEETN